MTPMYRTAITALLSAGFAIGCGGGDASPARSTPKRGKSAADAEKANGPATEPTAKRFQPVELTDGGDATDKSVSKAKGPDAKKSQATLAALQPFQVLLGEWSWGTRKAFGDFSKTGQDLQWVWDFQSHPNQPALKGVTDANPYFQKMWITWLADDEKFQLTGKTPEGES